MPTTLALWQDALKEVYTQDHLEEQFYAKFPFLEMIEKTDKYDIGRKAFVPVATYLPGGTSILPSTGGAINAAGNTGVTHAEYLYSWQYQPVSVQHSALVSSTGGTDEAVANVVDTELENAVKTIRKQLTRQVLTNQDALIAQCTTTTTSATIQLLTTGLGYDAIVRRWLHVNALVDIGTTGSEASITADSVITSVSKVASAPTITINTATVSTTTSHYVSLANARTGATSNESNGLQNIVSTSTSLGGLAASSEWAAANVDTTTTVLTLDSMLAIQESIQQETGEGEAYVLTSRRQLRRFYNQAQSQVRFAGDNPEEGNTGSVKWNGLSINAHPDVPNAHMWFLNPSDFIILRPKEGPRWMSEIGGQSARLEWTQGNTTFVDTYAYPFQFAAKRRNTHGGMTALT